MKRSLTICLAFVLLFTIIPFGAAALENDSSVEPRAPAVFCIECGSSNVTFEGYSYLSLGTQEAREGYELFYVEANYLCHDCGCNWATFAKYVEKPIG